MKGIILIEGGDASGKTTLARELVDRYGAAYLHSTVRKDIWRWHVGALRRAVRLSAERLVIMDRLWLSEQVYGQVFRGGPAYDLGARCIDRVLQAHGAITVLCAPRDIARQLKRHEALKSTRKEHFDTIEKVARLYLDLRLGNVAHPGNTYLDQLIRFGDFCGRDDVQSYDLERDGPDLARYATRLAQRAQRRSLEATAPIGIVGNTVDPDFLFVGERISPAWPKSLPHPWPFFWNDSASAATYLNRALHSLAFDETRGLWVNALSDAAAVQTAAGLVPHAKIICLGSFAQAACEKLKLPIHAAVVHPQYHRRFRAKHPQEYVNLLEGALR